MSKIDDDVILLDLVGQVLTETNGKTAWVLVRRSNGVKQAKTLLGMWKPEIAQAEFAYGLIERLNRQVAHDGVWAVAWCDLDEFMVPQRLMMLWKDGDGDVCFMLDTEDDVATLFRAGVDYYVNDATNAFAHYKQLMKAVGVRPDQTRKAAQGQMSVDPSAKAPMA